MSQQLCGCEFWVSGFESKKLENDPTESTTYARIFGLVYEKKGDAAKFLRSRRSGAQGCAWGRRARGGAEGEMSLVPAFSLDSSSMRRAGKHGQGKINGNVTMVFPEMGTVATREPNQRKPRSLESTERSTEGSDDLMIR